MRSRAVKKGSPVQSVLDFLQKNWIVLLGAVVAYPLIVRLMRMAEAKDKVAEVDAEQKELEAINKNPSTQKQALLDITTNEGYHDAAIAIKAGLGLPFSIWDWDTWTENDEAVFMAISNSPCGINIDDTLIDCYYFVSSGRNLYYDLEEHLNEGYFNQLNW